MKKKNVLQEKNSRIRKKNGDRGGVRAQEGGGGGGGRRVLPWDQRPRLAKSVTMCCQVGGGGGGGALPRMTDSRLKRGQYYKRLERYY